MGRVSKDERHLPRLRPAKTAGKFKNIHATFHEQIAKPLQARPLFLRIRREIEVTATFKHTKSELVRQRYDPIATADPIYFNAPEDHAFVRLDQALYDRIQAGRIRL